MKRIPLAFLAILQIMAVSAVLAQPQDGNLYLPLIVRAGRDSPQPDGFEAQVLQLVNNARSAAGCPTLVWDDRLFAAAERHSQDMATNDFVGHTGSDGTTPWDRIVQAGYTFATAAENVAAGYPTPSAVVAGWLDSPGHRANILNCALEETGVGYVYREDDPGTVRYQHYWTQVFATSP